MKQGDKVKYVMVNGEFEFGSEHTVFDCSVTLQIMTVEGNRRVHRVSEFTLPVPPKAGEWWVTRERRLVLIAHVTESLVYAVRSRFENLPEIDMFHADGRYAHSTETGQDLICKAAGSGYALGDLYRESIREEVPC